MKLFGIINSYLIIMIVRFCKGFIMKKIIFIFLMSISLFAHSLSTQEMQKWKSFGIDKEDISKWSKYGVKNPKEAKFWTKYGISPYQQNLDAINDWKKQGITYKILSEWINKTNLDFHSSFYLINKKLSMQEYLEYYKYFVENDSLKLKDVIKLKKWNIKPNLLISSMSKSGLISDDKRDLDKEAFLKVYNILKKENCQKIEKKPFSSIDPYNNENKCYTFVDKLIQRVDRNYGLAQSPFLNKYVYLKFNKDWSEGTYRNGIVKGKGTFSYTTQSGYKNSVPQGEILYYHNGI